LQTDDRPPTTTDSTEGAAPPTTGAGPRMRRRWRAPSEAEQSAIRVPVLVSAVRCTLTYVLFPLLAPLGAAAAAKTWVSIALHVATIAAVGFGTRRLFSTGSRGRWLYAAIAAPITVLSVIGIVADLAG
jgi:hypothetical protein